MTENKKQKAYVRIYAVILFTSAFVVLLLTALSQIKFNKYVDEYKYQINSQVGENQRFQLSLTSAIDENEKLKSDLDILNKEITSLNQNLQESQKKAEQQDKEYENKIKMYNTLIIAQNEYDKGNVTGCAEILFDNIDAAGLDTAQSELYRRLVEASFKKAANQLYNDGYKKFTEKAYAEAKDSFARSLKLADNEYYSDDCVYFLANIAYKEGDKAAMEAYIGILTERYPKSAYINDGKQWLKRMEK